MARQKALAAVKLEAVGLMTSSVAHDFTNVLSATAAGVHLLRKRGPEESLLSGIEEAVEHGKILIRSMLRFAKDQEIETQLCRPNKRISALEVLLGPTVLSGTRLRFHLPTGVNSSPGMSGAFVRS